MELDFQVEVAAACIAQLIGKEMTVQEKALLRRLSTFPRRLQRSRAGEELENTTILSDPFPHLKRLAGKWHPGS